MSKIVANTHSDTTSRQGDVALRPAECVMRLNRMGSFHQSRLSFMRVLLRRLKQQRWQFERTIWDVDANGVGVACYCAKGPERSYTLVAFAHDLPPELRSDRVIAEAWDATFTLFDGVPKHEDIERLRNNVPLQEAGRISNQELSLSRANRSVRLFNYVIECLAAGEQPELSIIEPVGYLMRTTAVYGSGKFGAADREKWAERPEFKGSFQPELLSVWLIRWFTFDLVEHLAKSKNPDSAVTLDQRVRRRMGVGNSTGLGMAPFLLTHPALIHSWISAREQALCQVRSQLHGCEEKSKLFFELLQRAQQNVAEWHSQHEYQQDRITCLRQDLALLYEQLMQQPLTGDYPWDRLFRWCEEHLTNEGQEQVVSLMLEPHAELVDYLAETMSFDENTVFAINGDMTVAELIALLEKNYAWAINTDFSVPERIARVWYVSEEKLEPRLGERFGSEHEPSLEPFEQALSPGRDAASLFKTLQAWPAERRIADFLQRHAEHRHIVRRVQLTAKLPYAEIYDNTIDAKMLPIDLLRCKLSFFGATKFDPRSDRWVRITLFQGAPLPQELDDLDPDELAYPSLESAMHRSSGHDSESGGGKTTLPL